ncbi:cob(I)yrinic acid a,c-diamide adenosyltransferase [Pseudothermotoga sp. U03pept]|uniref:cob(I)yrinic acid a,c-diamide adenosyltransferase n=1 Tax=Pseudothermotoga sp. U03pept TaxID=3447012 RepID=UPI003EFED059
MIGYVQVYTGNGKGKTTAALGLTLRAVGSGLKVYIAQFMKGMDYGELHSLKLLPNVTIERFGKPSFIHGKPDEEDIRIAAEGLKRVKEILTTGEYDIVILDEANVACYLGLFSAEQLVEVVQSRTPSTEVIVTGRYAPEELLEIADLVTEMKEVKHYYQKGVLARKGIEY